jgi:serine kinase of HPr protein (carbohydrate metabolism regulator)
MKVNFMKLSEIVSELNLQPVNKKPIKDDATILHGYSCDLLSQVLASAKSDSIWITVQSHLNVIGVAVTVGIPALIICEGHEIPENVIQKADEEQIAIFKSAENAFQLSGKLNECGIR